MSLCLSVRLPASLGAAVTGRIYVYLDIGNLYENLS